MDQNNTIPTAPEMPQAMPEPVVVAPSAPAAAGVGAASTPAPAPVAPVFEPRTASAPAVQPAAPVFEPASPAMNVPTEPSVVENVGLGATDPVTMPTPPAAPDPIEEELKAPLKAAAPVPGSIGSAVSASKDGQVTTTARPNPFANFGVKKETKSVAFNDPAAKQANQTAGTKPAKKKTSKTTYILLGVVAVIVIVALVVVLVSQLS